MTQLTKLPSFSLDAMPALLATCFPKQPQVYRKIIDDTLREVLQDFEEYGVDEEVRRALQSVRGA